MDDRDKVRRALRGLLLAFVLSALLWGAIIGIFLILRPPATGLAWWQLSWVRYGAVITLIAMVGLATAGEIIRIRTRRNQTGAETPAPWPVEEARQQGRVATARHAGESQGTRNAERAGDDVVRLP